jgi:hypothetical protein
VATFLSGFQGKLQDVIYVGIVKEGLRASLVSHSATQDQEAGVLSGTEWKRPQRAGLTRRVGSIVVTCAIAILAAQPGRRGYSVRLVG